MCRPIIVPLNMHGTAKKCTVVLWISHIPFFRSKFEVGKLHVVVGSQLRSQSILRRAKAQPGILSWIAYVKSG